MGFSAYNTETGEIEEICTVKELNKKIADTINFYKSRSEALAKVNNKLLEDARGIVDKKLKEENERLHAELRRAIVIFNSDKELTEYHKFCNDHLECRMNRKMDHGKMPYVTVHGTGLGTLFKVHCPICGECKDITDTEAW